MAAKLGDFAIWIASVASIALVGCNEPRSGGLEVDVWPLPRNITRVSSKDQQVDFLALSRSFRISLSCNTSSQSRRLLRALDRYQSLILPRKLRSQPVVQDGMRCCLSRLDVCVRGASLFGQEEYRLDVPDGKGSSVAVLEAGTENGALHGLETFSQLVFRSHKFGEYGLNGTSLPLLLHDWPRFKHRGLLLDTARHFFPIAAIHRTLDAMAASKLNVLHWHMVDSEAIPIESQRIPRFWDAAWSEVEVYTLEDMQEVVDYAADRGIRVIPELDVPGHSRAWFLVLPALFRESGCRTKWWAMDPSSNETFPTLDVLLHEFAERFPDEHFHVGGDEVGTSVWGDVRFDCWHHLGPWAKTKGFTTFAEVLRFFMENVFSTVRDAKKRPIVWDEVWRQVENLQEDVIVQVWEDPKLVKQIAEENRHDVIASPVGAWYLDDLDTSWEKMYTFEPSNHLAEDWQQRRLLGGEAALWAEKVDAATLDAVVWPRAAAVAERLWGDTLVGSDLLDAPERVPKSTVSRLASFRCLLLSRGIGASPLAGVGRAGLEGPSSCFGHSLLPLEEAGSGSEVTLPSRKKSSSARRKHSSKRPHDEV